MKTIIIYINRIALAIIACLSLTSCPPEPVISSTSKELSEGERAESDTKDNSPIIVLTVKEVTAAKIVILCEMKGTSVSYKINKGDHVKSDALNRTENREISFKNLDGETVYSFSAYGINADGIQGKELTIRVKTIKEPYTSYLRYYEERFIPITEAKMYKRSTSKANSKYLILEGASSDGWTVEIGFNYDVPYYESVSAEWEDGTYSIKSSGFYEYRVLGEVKTIRGNVYYAFDGPGTLKIETKGKQKVIEYINTDDNSKMHFEGYVY